MYSLLPISVSYHIYDNPPSKKQLIEVFFNTLECIVLKYPFDRRDDGQRLPILCHHIENLEKLIFSLPYLGTPPPFNCVPPPPPPPFGQFKNKFGDTKKRGRQGSKLLGRRYLYHLPTGGLEEGYLGVNSIRGRVVAAEY